MFYAHDEVCTQDKIILTDSCLFLESVGCDHLWIIFLVCLLKMLQPIGSTKMFLIALIGCGASIPQRRGNNFGLSCCFPVQETKSSPVGGQNEIAYERNIFCTIAVFVFFSTYYPFVHGWGVGCFFLCKEPILGDINFGCTYIANFSK